MHKTMCGTRYYLITTSYTMSRPRISVIVTAYNRRQYLRYAVKSVLNQSVDRNLYEIVLIKNFKDPEIDDTISRYHGKIIHMDVMSIGAKFAKGIEESEGEIIAFLEDDDLWHYKKLEQILKEFSKDDNLIYYHHNVYVINESGQIVRDLLIENTNVNRYIKAETSQEKLYLFKKHGWYLGLRMSSIVVRRDAYAKYTSIIKLLPDVIDVAIYLLSLATPGTLIHTPERLAFYRIHSQSASSTRLARGEERLTRAIRNSVRHAIARHGLITLAKIAPDISKYITYDEASIIGGIFANWRHYTVAIAINTLRTCRTVNCIATAILGIVNAISPTLAKTILTKYYKK